MTAPPPPASPDTDQRRQADVDAAVLCCWHEAEKHMRQVTAQLADAYVQAGDGTPAASLHWTGAELHDQLRDAITRKWGAREVAT